MKLEDFSKNAWKVVLHIEIWMIKVLFAFGVMEQML